MSDTDDGRFLVDPNICYVVITHFSKSFKWKTINSEKQLAKFQNNMGAKP